MNSFVIALNVVVPLVVLIGVGYFFKEKNIVSKTSFSQINQLVFRLLIPCVLMKNIMDTDLSIAFQPDLLLYAIGSIFVLCITSWIVIGFFVKDKRQKGVLIQSLYRSNFVLFGLPIAINMYGPDNVAVTTLLIATCVPIFNVIAVIVLEYHGKEKVNIQGIFKGLLTNPMMIGSILGLLILFLNIQLPKFMLNSISDLSKIATPLALIVLGGTFEFPALNKNKWAIFLAVTGKLIVVPLLFLSLAIHLGYRNIELVSLLVLFGSPVAVSSYPMAEAMGCDGELASQLVLVSTVFSIFSMILWIFTLSSLGLV